MKKITIGTFILISCLTTMHARSFKIVANNVPGRGLATDTIKSGNFVLGVSDYGGGYITKIELPGLGNIMGIAAQRYGRGGQSSIRDMVREGCYNPTQAGFNDNAGTECQVTKTHGKMVVEPRGCVLYNGDGGFDYIRWENIIADPYKEDNGNSDLDNVEEENLSVVIKGITYAKQEAEVYSDFDFYGEYENYKEKVGLDVPCVRHYLEYRFIRSSLMPNSPLKQFNKAALTAQGFWDAAKLLPNIRVTNPVGTYPSGEDHLNRVLLSSSIRNDSAIWDPAYRYVQLVNGTWQRQIRGTSVISGYDNVYKLRFIIAESADENTGHALGFYRPDSHLNKFNVVGVNETTNTEVYEDNRIIDNFFIDSPRRTTDMSWIGFRNESRGLISRGRLTGAYDGVYEKQRQESFILYGTPAQLKIAFAKLDVYYSNLTSIEGINNNEMKTFQILTNPSKEVVNLKFNSTSNKVSIYNSVGVLVYSNSGLQTETSIPTNQIGGNGVYFVKVNNATQKLIISN